MIKKVKKGFTLIELVVVIAVIAILSAVSVVAYVGITNSAKKSTAQQEADQIAMTIRAAALTNAKGYEEQKAVPEVESVKKPYTLVWTKNGLEIYRQTGDTREIGAILKDVYEELEDTTLSATLGVKSGVAFDSNGKALVAEFTYLNENAYKEAVTASFINK